jgi:hypothetical protein
MSAIVCTDKRETKRATGLKCRGYCGKEGEGKGVKKAAKERKLASGGV